MINLGWVDFSKSDRNMVLNVLRQLTEPGAVDELGIGTIRDAFADIPCLSMPYRVTLGQARQEELLEYLFNNRNVHEIEELFINLSPFSR